QVPDFPPSPCTQGEGWGDGRSIRFRRSSMRWWFKAAIQQATGYTPGGAHLHRWLQLRFGELAHIEQSTRFGNAAMLVEMARNWCGPLQDQKVVELGTGWVPAVPLSFLLVGARVETYDV